MKSRPYQIEAERAALRELKQSASTLIVLATGLGKTVIFSSVIGKCVGRGKRALVIAHREELIDQGASKIKAVTGEIPDIEMGDRWATETLMGKATVVVGSVQTLSRGRMERFDPKEFGLIVIDEAHHAVASSYRRILDYFKAGNPNIKILGVTATPDRADEEALVQVFGSCAFEYGVADGIRDGWLVDIEQQIVNVDGLDYQNVGTVAGDFNQGELSAVMEQEEPLHGIASATLKIAGNRKTILFAVSVKQAEMLMDIFNRHRPGIARLVTGKTPKDERREMLKDYADGRFQILCNVGVATEGFDEPGVECVVMARLTKSRSLYAQMIGRGTRPLPGTVDGPHTEHWNSDQRLAAIKASKKPSVLILDFEGNAGRHSLIHAADVLGGKISETAIQKAKGKSQGKPKSVLEALSEAEIEEVREKEAAERRRRAKLTGKASFSTEKVSPFDIFGRLPDREPAWHKGRRPSPKMVAFLRRNNVPNPESLTFTQASALIDKIIYRRQHGLCTFAQANRLRQCGYEDADNYTVKQASELIGALRQNGWKKLEETATW